MLVDTDSENEWRSTLDDTILVDNERTPLLAPNGVSQVKPQEEQFIERYYYHDYIAVVIIGSGAGDKNYKIAGSGSSLISNFDWNATTSTELQNTIKEYYQDVKKRTRALRVLHENSDIMINSAIAIIMPEQKEAHIAWWGDDTQIHSVEIDKKTFMPMLVKIPSAQTNTNAPETHILKLEHNWRGTTKTKGVLITSKGVHEALTDDDMTTITIHTYNTSEANMSRFTTGFPEALIIAAQNKKDSPQADELYPNNEAHRTAVFLPAIY